MAPELRFVVDVNVGRLAKWLRVMGYDTLFPPESGDNELVRIALREERALVTRDSGIARRRAAQLGQLRVVLITADDLRGQLRQLMHELQLNIESGFSRCVRCNELLQEIDKAEVTDRIPPYVSQTQGEFMTCPRCSRVYWRGTHWSNMMEELEKMREEAP